jgi:hypothetical protein
MSTLATKPNKAAALARVQALVAGITKHFPNGSFTLGTTTVTAAALIQEIQDLEQAMIALNVAQGNAKDAMVVLRKKEVDIAPQLRAFHHYLLAAFSNSTPTLADFGLQPPKTAKPLASEKRTTATVKMRATRAARGTMSKKQKLAITGNVTGIVVTPITQGPASPGAAPAAPPAASPAAPPATTATPAAVSPAASTPVAPR